MRAERAWSFVPLGMLTLFLAFFVALGGQTALHWSARSGFLLWLALAMATLRSARRGRAARPGGEGHA